MRILVTGGLGFLGTHLIERLLAAHPDDEIHIVDDLSSSVVTDPEIFLEYLGRPENVKFTLSTVHHFCDLVWEDYDQIYHLASIVGPAGVLPHAGTIATSILNDTASVAKKALDNGSRLLFVSTSEIYGGGLSGEDHDKVVTSKVSARLEYAIGKLAAEIMLINQAKNNNLNVVIVRPFNIAGPRQSANGGFVLPRFCAAAIKGEPLTVFGKGEQIRAFTDVRDMVDGIYLTMQHGDIGESYNIGDLLNKTDMNNLAKSVIEYAKSKSEIKHVDPKKIYGPHYEEAKDKLPIATKAHRDLGWRPQHRLHEIIRSALKWEREGFAK